jgi:D-galactarolactone cycloisomerase
MYHHTRDYGMKGAVIGAISGVDIALWDIAGKARGEPVAKLLGGMFRDRVQAYATGFYRISGRGEAPRLAAEAVEKLEAGFRALKVKLGFGLDDDLAVMRAIRDATAGRSYEAMIDTNHAYGVAEAIALGRGLEAMGWKLRWYEEPVTQEDLDGYGEVRRALATPIAGGEPAGSLAAATSPRSRRPTACRSTRTSGPPRSARQRRCSSSPRCRSRTTRSSQPSRCSSSTPRRIHSAST